MRNYEVVPKPYILGIDPGLKGAICFIPLDSKEDVYVYDMPVQSVKVGNKLKRRINVHKLYEIVSFYTKEFNICYSAIEEQHSRPGGTRQSSDTLMLNYGCLLACLQICDIRFKEYHPQTWQKLSKPVDEEEELDGKELSMHIAEELFPNVEISRHDIADALLIGQAAKMEIDNGDILL